MSKLRGETSKVLFAILPPFYTGLKFQHASVCKIKNIKDLSVIEREADTACES